MKAECTIDPRVFRLIARRIAQVYSMKQISEVLNAKSQIKDPEKYLFTVFTNMVAKADLEGHSYDWGMIDQFLNPLNLDGDEDSISGLANYLDSLLIKYSDYRVFLNTEIIHGDEYHKRYWPDDVDDETNLVTQEVLGLKGKIDLVEEIEQLHSTYAGIIYDFCRHLTPTPDLNVSYIALRDALRADIERLGLKYMALNLVVPFYGDLYSAGDEWSGTYASGVRQYKDEFYGPIEWGKIRSKLLHTTGQIEELKRLALGEVISDSASTIIADANKIIEKNREKYANKVFKQSGSIEIEGKAGMFTFNLDTGDAQLNKIKKVFALNTQTYKVLRALAENKGDAVPYQQLFTLLGKKDDKKSKQELRLIINDLKKRLGILPGKGPKNKNVLHTVIKIGYKLSI